MRADYRVINAYSEAPGLPVMPDTSFLSAIFDEEPPRWGLRGDPHLWAALRDSFQSTEMPDTIAALVGLIESRFEELTGQPLQGVTPFQVPSFSRGGMSSGMIERQGFWISIALPLLISRFCQAKSDQLR